MKKINMSKDARIATYQRVSEMFLWCIDHFGLPGARWIYGRDTDGFLGKDIICSSMEMGMFVFTNDDDALVFKLIWS
jgi:hypothetical protein